MESKSTHYELNEDVTKIGFSKLLSEIQNKVQYIFSTFKLLFSNRVKVGKNLSVRFSKYIKLPTKSRIKFQIKFIDY